MTGAPVPYSVVARRQETDDTATLRLRPVAEQLPAFAPGQFAMVYAFGRGEIPLSVSEIPPDGGLCHTVREVGAVSEALSRAREGEVIGLRGPFGTTWDLETAVGRDIVVIAGGIGLAPLRPLVHAVTADRDRFGRLNVLIGARTPADLIHAAEIETWPTTFTGVTVDRPDDRWRGHVGLVTQLLDSTHFDPGTSTAFLCGPEPMIRSAARNLSHRGIPEQHIQVSLERNMRCGTGHCGHCQLGPVLLCRDGPVLSWDRAAPLLGVREL
ncbi:FAD/NAD(P)-binding protein [Streptomyces sp. NBC_00390]|uniref:FAD/NAD(P)-binding protein n=1 Tax=Streptomyces sp. NBC_00390 TaxID=2975736 RepID=UPI002E215CB2